MEATFYTPDGQLQHGATFGDWEVSFVEGVQNGAGERDAELRLWQGGDDIVTCRWRGGRPTFGAAKVSWPGQATRYSGTCTLSPWP